MTMRSNWQSQCQCFCHAPISALIFLAKRTLILVPKVRNYKSYLMHESFTFNKNKPTQRTNFSRKRKKPIRGWNITNQFCSRKHYGQPKCWDHNACCKEYCKLLAGITCSIRVIYQSSCYAVWDRRKDVKKQDKQWPVLAEKERRRKVLVNWIYFLLLLKSVQGLFPIQHPRLGETDKPREGKSFALEGADINPGDRVCEWLWLTSAGAELTHRIFIKQDLTKQAYI